MHDSTESRCFFYCSFVLYSNPCLPSQRSSEARWDIRLASIMLNSPVGMSFILCSVFNSKPRSTVGCPSLPPAPVGVMGCDGSVVLLVRCTMCHYVKLLCLFSSRVFSLQSMAAIGRAENIELLKPHLGLENAEELPYQQHLPVIWIIQWSLTRPLLLLSVLLLRMEVVMRAATSGNRGLSHHLSFWS